MTTQADEKTKTFSRTVSLKDLNLQVPEKMVSPKHFAVWVRSLLQNWRQGTVGVKERSDVARSTKKPWKQKGTGRARAGSARSPLWRGGGVTFGPQARVKKLTVPQKIKKQVFKSMLADRAVNKQLFVVDWTLSSEKPSTKQAMEMLKNAKLNDKKIVLLISSNDALTFASFVNLPKVKVLLMDQANAYDLANGDAWVVLSKDFDQFKQVAGGWQ